MSEHCKDCKFCRDAEYCVWFRQNVDCYQEKCKAFEKR